MGHNWTTEDKLPIPCPQRAKAKAKDTTSGNRPHLNGMARVLKEVKVNTTTGTKREERVPGNKAGKTTAGHSTQKECASNTRKENVEIRTANSNTLVQLAAKKVMAATNAIKPNLD